MTSIEHVVMARVRRIHMIRRFLHPTLMKVYGGILMLGALVSTVSVANIVANMPSLTAPSQLVHFTLTALTRTEAFVQLMVVGVIVTCVLLVRDIVQNIKQGVHLQHI